MAQPVYFPLYATDSVVVQLLVVVHRLVPVCGCDELYVTVPQFTLFVPVYCVAPQAHVLYCLCGWTASWYMLFVKVCVCASAGNSAAGSNAVNSITARKREIKRFFTFIMSSSKLNRYCIPCQCGKAAIQAYTSSFPHLLSYNKRQAL